MCSCLFYWLLWFLNVCYLFYLQYFMYGFIEKWAQQQYFSGYFNSGSELNKYRLYSQEEKKEIWSIFTFSKWNNWIWNKTINKRLTWNFLFLQVYIWDISNTFTFQRSSKCFSSLWLIKPPACLELGRGILEILIFRYPFRPL